MCQVSSAAGAELGEDPARAVTPVPERAPRSREDTASRGECEQRSLPCASPCGHHTGQPPVMHCSPRRTQQGGDPLANPSERI